MSRKPLIVISTGAGVSAESGISTFRDTGGLWEQYPVMQVASAEGFAANPALVHQFYNDRRRQLLEAEPNQAHRILARLQDDFDVRIITQNVDDLHERAGSDNVLHLHGELMKMRSVSDPDYIVPLTPPELDTTPQTRGPRGDLMRPHIVFFGEPVPNMGEAIRLAQEADIFVVIGTSLQVYPAASLITCVRPGTPVWYIDPHPAMTPPGVNVIKAPATSGVASLAETLTTRYKKN